MATVTDERTSSSSSHRWSYDVFLSFRGEDCRRGFVGHLYSSLCEKGFNTFADNDLGAENINLELLRVIELSKISIIVFSKNYASSTWCLNQLVKIIECMTMGQSVIPVFYKVSPSEIRHSQGRFGVDLAKHEIRLKDNVETVQRWRASLSQAANISGFHYDGGTMESDVIKKIVENIQRKVMHSEDQTALHRPTMYPEEDRAYHRPILSPEEPTLSPEEQLNARIYYGNYVSVVGILRNGLELGGSGFIWDNMGHIVTNWHVIQNASDFKVYLFDGRTCEANVVGFNQYKDVAVLHAEELEGEVKPISIGLSANLLVGQKVFAIGFPYGLRFSFSHGIISGLHREIKFSANHQPIQDVIQTSVVMNPGNSGGPLFDSAGRLVGINTAIHSSIREFCGIAYSITIHSVRGIIDKIVTCKKVRKPHLGITLSSLRLPDDLDVLLVLDVVANGPAAKAGLQKTELGAGILGDTITSVNGQKVTNSYDLYMILDLCEVGDEVVVEVLRGEHKKEITVTLEPNIDKSKSNDMLNPRAFKA